jgi:hypothetical protein
MVMNKIYMDFDAKLGTLTKKYGLKMVGSWAITQEHVTIMIIDAPDPGAMLKFMRDPGTSDWQSHHIIKTRPAVTLEEAMKMLK